MRRHRIAPEQVFHIQLLELLQAGTAAGQRCHAGHAAHMHRQPLQALDDLVALAARQARNRQQHVGDGTVAHHLGQAAGGPDLQPVDAVVGLGRIVIDKADQRVLARVVQRGGRLYAGFAGTIDQQPALLARLVAAGVHEQAAHKGTVAAHQQQEQQWLQDADAARHGRRIAKEHHVDEEQHAIHGHRLDGGDHGAEAGVAENRPVQAELDHDRDRQRRCQQIGGELRGVRRHPQVQPQADAQPQRQPGAQHIHQHRHELLGQGVGIKNAGSGRHAGDRVQGLCRMPTVMAMIFRSSRKLRSRTYCRHSASLAGRMIST